MAKKRVKSDFEDMLEERDEFVDEFDFDEEDFQDTKGKKKKHGRRKHYGHWIFFITCIFIFGATMFSLYIWNMGDDSENNKVIDESLFDTEPNDYIQPMTSEQLAGWVDDGKTTILALGNSGFADNGDENALAKAFATTMNAEVINCAIPGSQICRSLEDDISIMNPGDGVSLYYVTEALCTGDNSKVVADASTMGDEALARANRLSQVDMTSVDCVVIFYDITDYLNKMLIYSPVAADDNRAVSGALMASINMIQQQYPYIRIVVMSPPASGKTIDGYYVDATYIDLGGGTMSDYMGRELEVAATTGVSYIDLMYGAITVDNRDQYIYDDYHINEAGAQVIADRFAQLINL